MEIKQAARTVAEREDEGTVVHVKDEMGEKQYKLNSDGTPMLGENKKPIPVTIKVAGTYSSRYRRAVDANRDRLLKRRGSSLDGDALKEQGLAIVAACILAWDGFTTRNDAGTEVEYKLTKDNAMALLDQCPWIQEQVETAMSDHASFSKAS